MKNLIIGIDGNEANVQKRVGISEYAFELLAHFKAQKKGSIQFLIYLKNNPVSDLPLPSANWQYKVIGPKKLWTQLALPISLFFERKKPHVFFTPSHYAPRFATMPTAIAIMDVAYLHFPSLFAKSDLYQLTHWTAYSVMKAKIIFTISQSSKDDIIKYYNISQDKIIVTYPGIKGLVNEKKDNITMNDLQKKYAIKEKYILFVGTIQPRKNIARLIEAFSFVIKKHKDIDLVIIGKKGWLYEKILNAPERFGISKNVHFLDFVVDSELELFYKNAICYILPSLYEGFGLPVLEAMKYSCPVITSNVSSLPEAGGDACLYVDPQEVKDIAEKMIMMIEDKNMRNSLREKGLKHLKKFSWKKTAEKTLSILEQIALKNS